MAEGGGEEQTSGAPSGTHDVFISYASANSAVAEAACAAMEQTGMTFGPDRRLYVSNFGAAPAGAGQILRFDIAPGW